MSLSQVTGPIAYWACIHHLPSAASKTLLSACVLVEVTLLELSFLSQANIYGVQTSESLKLNSRTNVQLLFVLALSLFTIITSSVIVSTILLLLLLASVVGHITKFRTFISLASPIINSQDIMLF